MPQPRLFLRILHDDGDGSVILAVHHEDFTRQPHRLEHPVKDGNDALALVVGRNNNRDARYLGHTSTPLPSTFHMSAIGLSLTRSRYSGCGAAITSRSLSSSTCCIGTSLGSFLT